MTVLNRYPYNNGHLLVCPLRHEPRLDSLTDDEHLEAGRQTARLLNVLEKHLQCVGFNVGLNLGRVAGAGVPGHLHWHIVPRWDGDTNFMPVLAGTHVIPQSLESLWELMVEALGECPAP
jgi:ATP adenylyltransferase